MLFSYLPSEKTIEAIDDAEIDQGFSWKVITKSPNALEIQLDWTHHKYVSTDRGDVVQVNLFRKFDDLGMEQETAEK